MGRWMETLHQHSDNTGIGFASLSYSQEQVKHRKILVLFNQQFPAFIFYNNQSLCTERQLFTFNVACGVISVLETAHTDFSVFICTR